MILDYLPYLASILFGLLIATAIEYGIVYKIKMQGRAYAKDLVHTMGAVRPGNFIHYRRTARLNRRRV